MVGEGSKREGGQTVDQIDTAFKDRARGNLSAKERSEAYNEWVNARDRALGTTPEGAAERGDKYGRFLGVAQQMTRETEQRIESRKDAGITQFVKRHPLLSGVIGMGVASVLVAGSRMYSERGSASVKAENPAASSKMPRHSRAPVMPETPEKVEDEVPRIEPEVKIEVETEEPETASEPEKEVKEEEKEKLSEAGENPEMVAQAVRIKEMFRKTYGMERPDAVEVEKNGSIVARIYSPGDEKAYFYRVSPENFRNFNEIDSEFQKNKSLATGRFGPGRIEGDFERKARNKIDAIIKQGELVRVENATDAMKKAKEELEKRPESKATEKVAPPLSRAKERERENKMAIKKYKNGGYGGGYVPRGSNNKNRHKFGR